MERAGLRLSEAYSSSKNRDGPLVSRVLRNSGGPKIVDFRVFGSKCQIFFLARHEISAFSFGPRRPSKTYYFFWRPFHLHVLYMIFFYWRA